MDEQQTLIVETAKRIFADQCDKPIVDAAEVSFSESGELDLGTFPQALWQTLAETGLTSVGVDTKFGGAGGSFADALLILSEAGAAAAPIPLADHLVAIQLLASCGVSAPTGIVTLCCIEDQSQSLQGSFVPVADWVLIVKAQQLVLVKNENIDWDIRPSIAGEALAVVDAIDETGGQVYDLADALEVARLLGARSRVSLMSGAMNKVLEMSVAYVSDREQFGRALSKFQAIQHQLAVAAGEVASCQRAADSLLDDPATLDVAIAKARVGEAVTLVTEVAHQVHGAIGYTLEHGLNHRTRRLWQWRDDFGGERYWQLHIGRAFCESGPDQLWAGITHLG